MADKKRFLSDTDLLPQQELEERRSKLRGAYMVNSTRYHDQSIFDLTIKQTHYLSGQFKNYHEVEEIDTKLPLDCIIVSHDLETLQNIINLYILEENVFEKPNTPALLFLGSAQEEQEFYDRFFNVNARFIPHDTSPLATVISHDLENALDDIVLGTSE